MKTIWQGRMLMLVLAVLIVLRPGFGEEDVRRAAPGSDLEVLLVVDRTVSMSALDYAGVRSRLEGVREDLTDVVELLPHSRFALVTFGREAVLDAPLTSDADQVLYAIDGLAREPLLSGVGSTIDRPLEQMRALLARGQQQHPDRRRILVFVSDGERTVPGKQRSFAPLEEFIDEGAVFGYGTPAGGLMPTGGEPPWTFVRDRSTGRDALSKMDATNLRRIADQLGIAYAHRASPGGLGDWAAALRRGTPGPDMEPEKEYEVYWLLALLLFGMALFELRHDWFEWLEARRELAQ